MSDHWDRVGALFEAAVALPPRDRVAHVNASDEPDAVRQEVLSLLASHDEATDFLEQPAAAPPLESESDEDAPLLAEGTLLGQYRIVRVVALE